MTLDGKILGVLGETGRQLKQFGWIHEIACPSENVLFVAEIINWRIQKLLLHPSRRSRRAGKAFRFETQKGPRRKRRGLSV